MKTSKGVIPFVIYLIIAVGMLGIYKWAGLALTHHIAMVWTFYAGARALCLAVLGGKAVDIWLKSATDQASLTFMTVVVGIIPFIFLGWLGPLAFGCVSLAFECLSYQLVRKYTWSKTHGRHYH